MLHLSNAPANRNGNIIRTLSPALLLLSIISLFYYFYFKRPECPLPCNLSNLTRVYTNCTIQLEAITRTNVEPVLRGRYSPLVRKLKMLKGDGETERSERRMLQRRVNEEWYVAE